MIGIGSTNPAKVSAVESAVLHAWKVRPSRGDRPQFVAVEVSSGVSAQPLTDEETKQGARNRARAVLESGPNIDIAFGLEGGVASLEDGLYSTVWICVAGKSGREILTNGLRFRLPSALAEPILAGEEMGAVMDRLCARANVKHKEGMIGVLTEGVVTRSQGYESLARLAYGLYLSNFAPTP